MWAGKQKIYKYPKNRIILSPNKYMLTTKELEIVDLFRKNLFLNPTIREIMKLIKTKSYNWTHHAVLKLAHENIINLTKKGSSQICTISLENQKTLSYLGLLEENIALNAKIPHIETLFELMPKVFHILLITGSYANKTFTKKSDIDVVVIIEQKEEKKWLQNTLSNKGELLIPALHPYVFTREEFMEMLINKELNYGKEIAKKHLILTGAELYFKIIREAIDHGYKNQTLP